MPTVIVSGALANKPFNGGNAWSRLSWLQGFKHLGYDVHFVEQIDPAHCHDAAGQPSPFETSINRTYFRDTLAAFGFANHASLLCGDACEGVPLTTIRGLAAQSEFLFNLSGHLTREDLLAPIPCKIFYDDDPGFTQFWHAAGNAGARLAGHDFHFTIGANIGATDCVIPSGSIRWRHTRPPVVLADWPACPPHAFERFTTVSSWRGAYGPVTHAGVTYGLKVHEFRKLLELPRRCDACFEIALQIDPADARDREALLAHGWKLADPRQVADSCDAFRRYVQTSSAEFSVAQGVYAATNSGWFSDRTVRYLASGRPALVQETGASRHLPVGDGLLTFRTCDEAVEGAQRIVADYAQHAHAARRLAERYFDSDRVIRNLLDEIGIPLP